MLPIRMKYVPLKRLEQLKRNAGSAEYKKWREAVLERDNHQCQWPGCTRTEKLQVHHIMRHANFPHLRTAVHNGVTLCKDHHENIHGVERAYELMFFRIVQRNAKEQDLDNS